MGERPGSTPYLEKGDWEEGARRVLVRGRGIKREKNAFEKKSLLVINHRNDQKGKGNEKKESEKTK